MREFGSTPGSWLVRGYVEAVERFREQAALGADSAREVYPPLFEALNWAHALWDTWFRLVEPQDRHLDGLRYVRPLPVGPRNSVPRQLDQGRSRSAACGFVSG
jgi:hypothetical protein